MDSDEFARRYLPRMDVPGLPSVRMWRCAGCGKWDHTEDRPTFHPLRLVKDDGCAVIEPCGPFEEWLGVRVE